MNQNFSKIADFVERSENLSHEENFSLVIIAFKLDRTEKVKRTTAILLEETIEELEQKRKVVEETNLALRNNRLLF